MNIVLEMDEVRNAMRRNYRLQNWKLITYDSTTGKYTCQCGSILRGRVVNHFDTAKHVDFISGKPKLDLTYCEKTKKYICKCGTYVKKQNIKCHMQTTKHKVLMNEVEKEIKNCDICYKKKTFFIKCDVCSNCHCTSCNKQIDKCPFCRTIFKTNK